MKNGTVYAARLKKAYAKQKRSVGKTEPVADDDPMRRLAIGVLGVVNGDDFAERLVNRLLASVVSWNEVRVSSAIEVQRAAGDTVDSHGPYYEALIRAVQAVFDQENVLALDRLKSMGRRDAKAFLDSLDGVDEHTAASVILWSLGGHAIPVCDRLLEALRAADLVHPDASRAEVQAFLERHVPASEARDFCLVMRSFSGPKRGVKKTTRTSSTKSAAKKKPTAKRKTGTSTPKKKRSNRAAG